MKLSITAAANFLNRSKYSIICAITDGRLKAERPPGDCLVTIKDLMKVKWEGEE